MRTIPSSRFIDISVLDDEVEDMGALRRNKTTRRTAPY